MSLFDTRGKLHSTFIQPYKARYYQMDGYVLLPKKLVVQISGASNLQYKLKALSLVQRPLRLHCNWLLAFSFSSGCMISQNSMYNSSMRIDFLVDEYIFMYTGRSNRTQMLIPDSMFFLDQVWGFNCYFNYYRLCYVVQTYIIQTSRERLCLCTWLAQLQQFQVSIRITDLHRIIRVLANFASFNSLSYPILSCTAKKAC